MNIFEKYLLERHGEYKELDKQLENLFPYLVQVVKDFKYLIADYPEYKPESKFVKKYIKGNDIKIVMLPSKISQNAMTCPMKSKIPTGIGPQVIRDYLETLNQFTSVSERLQKAKRNSNGVVVLPNTGFVITIYVTKAFIQSREPEERIAVYLHEIGHWAYTEDIKKMFKESLSWKMYIPILNLFQIEKINLLSRQNEYKADGFVKKLGYGKELVLALDNIIKPRKYMNILLKILDVLLYPLNLLATIGETTHPNIKNRKKKLLNRISSISKKADMFMFKHITKILPIGK